MSPGRVVWPPRPLRRVPLPSMVRTAGRKPSLYRLLDGLLDHGGHGRHQRFYLSRQHRIRHGPSPSVRLAGLVQALFGTQALPFTGRFHSGLDQSRCAGRQPRRQRSCCAGTPPSTAVPGGGTAPSAVTAAPRTPPSAVGLAPGSPGSAVVARAKTPPSAVAGGRSGGAAVFGACR